MHVSCCRGKTSLIPRGKVLKRKCQRRHHCGNYHALFCNSPVTFHKNRKNNLAFIFPFFQFQNLSGSWGLRSTFPGDLNQTKEPSLFRWGCTWGKAGVQARLRRQVVLLPIRTRRSWVCHLTPLTPPRRPTPISLATAQRLCHWSPTHQNVLTVYLSNVNKVQKHQFEWKACKALMRKIWPASGKHLQESLSHPAIV